MAKINDKIKDVLLMCVTRREIFGIIRSRNKESVEMARDLDSLK